MFKIYYVGAKVLSCSSNETKNFEQLVTFANKRNNIDSIFFYISNEDFLFSFYDHLNFVITQKNVLLVQLEF